MAKNVPKRCVTGDRVPLTLFTFSDGLIVHVRFGCLCSSVILYSDSVQSPAIPSFPANSFIIGSCLLRIRNSSRSRNAAPMVTPSSRRRCRHHGHLLCRRLSSSCSSSSSSGSCRRTTSASTDRSEGLESGHSGCILPHAPMVRRGPSTHGNERGFDTGRTSELTRRQGSLRHSTC